MGYVLVFLAIVFAGLWWLSPVALAIVGGAAFGLLLLTIAFALMTPLFITQLVNKPDKESKSGFHLFTYPEEGKVKIVVRGDRVIRMIMMYANHRFARVKNPDASPYWEIVEGDSEDPLLGISLLLRPWAQYVYHTTGAVFTGIWPLQTVREYPLERTKMYRDETKADGNIKLQVTQDYSDHYRSRQFLYPFRVPAADTKDKISLNILAVIKAHVTNPHKAAFGTDRWDLQMVNLATNAVTNFTRSNNLDRVLSAIDSTEAKTINLAIKAIKDDEEQYGIEIDGVDLIDISPNLSDEELAKLYAEALAKPVGEATVIDMKKRAEGLRALNEANQAGGTFALETQRAEALVRAAEAAKGGAVIMSPGGQSSVTDPTMTAILAELRKLNRKERK